MYHILNKRLNKRHKVWSYQGQVKNKFASEEIWKKTKMHFFSAALQPDFPVFLKIKKKIFKGASELIT